MIQAPALAPPKPRETEYRCPSCGWWLFSSTATWGKVTAKCSNRRCTWRGQVFLSSQRVEMQTLSE